MDLRNDTGTIAHVGTQLDRLIAVVTRSYHRCSPREPLSPRLIGRRFGSLSGKQFAIYGGSIAVGLAALLGGVLILTRRAANRPKRSPACSVPCGEGAIDMTATGPRIAVYLHERERRRSAGLFLRRHHGEHHHQIVTLPRSLRHLKQLELYLQEQVGDYAGCEPGTRRDSCPPRQRPKVR